MDKPGVRFVAPDRSFSEGVVAFGLELHPDRMIVSVGTRDTGEAAERSQDEMADPPRLVDDEGNTYEVVGGGGSVTHGVRRLALEFQPELHARAKAVWLEIGGGRFAFDVSRAWEL